MMKKKNIINVSIILLCVIAICINSFFEQYKSIGGGCMLLMGFLAILKDRIIK